MKATIKLSKNGQTVAKEEQVNAYKTDSKSLVVHHPVVYYMNASEPTVLKSWVISHVETGELVINLASSRKSAIKAANLLAKLSGWETLTRENALEFYNANIETFKLAKITSQE